MRNKLLDRFFNGEIYFICRSKNDVVYLLDMVGDKIVNRNSILRGLDDFTEKRLWTALEYETYHVLCLDCESKAALISYAATIIPNKKPVSIRRL